jgi:hypothetical protein
VAEIGTAQRDNAVPSISFFTDNYAITTGMVLTITHGLPKIPKNVWLRVKNITAELGYAVGDEVNIASGGAASAAGSASVAVNITEIKVVLAALPVIVDFGTQAQTAITAANWQLVVKAEIA